MVSSLRKFVWMIVALAAMIWLAPAAASAHEGHHGAGVHRPQPAVAVSLADFAATAQATPDSVLRAGVAAPSSADAFCLDGCCAGMACCFVALASTPPGLSPPVASVAQVSPRAPPSPAGVRPLRQLEPPNALT